MFGENRHNENEGFGRRPFPHNNVNFIGVIRPTESAGATSIVKREKYV